MQSYAVVVYVPCCIYRAMQMPISLLLVELEFISPHVVPLWYVSIVQYDRHKLNIIWDKNIGIKILQSR